MKRNITLFVMLLGLAGLLAIQSCKKTAGPEPKLYEAAMPSAPSPALGGVLEFTGAGQSVPMTWTATATTAPTWDVYFGPSEDAMDLVASNVSGNAYTVTVDEGGLYYWQVVTTDANGIETASPVWHFDVNSNPAVPVLTPVNGATGVSTSVALTWTHSDPEGDALSYDVYLGSTITPGAVAAGLTSATYSPSGLTPFTKYYWRVVAKDPYGGLATSPVDSFTTGALPINAFVGDYNADEPAEAYSYDVSFTRVDDTHIKTTNYWNSAWNATFAIDFTNKLYSMPFTKFTTSGTIWSGIESGSVDLVTGKMQGTYTIWRNGVIFEQGVHTYTKL